MIAPSGSIPSRSSWRSSNVRFAPRGSVTSTAPLTINRLVRVVSIHSGTNTGYSQCVAPAGTTISSPSIPCRCRCCFAVGWSRTSPSKPSRRWIVSGPRKVVPRWTFRTSSRPSGTILTRGFIVTATAIGFSWVSGRPALVVPESTSVARRAAVPASAPQASSTAPSAAPAAIAPSVAVTPSGSPRKPMPTAPAKPPARTIGIVSLAAPPSGTASCAASTGPGSNDSESGSITSRQAAGPSSVAPSARPPTTIRCAPAVAMGSVATGSTDPAPSSANRSSRPSGARMERSRSSGWLAEVLLADTRQLPAGRSTITLRERWSPANAPRTATGGAAREMSAVPSGATVSGIAERAIAGAIGPVASSIR